MVFTMEATWLYGSMLVSEAIICAMLEKKFSCGEAAFYKILQMNILNQGILGS